MNNDMNSFNSTQPGMQQSTNPSFEFTTNRVINEIPDFDTKPSQPPKKSGKSFIFIVVIVVVIIVIVLIYRYYGNGNHQNNTGYGYSNSDVSFNCTKTTSDYSNTYEQVTYVDLLFNKQDADVLKYTKMTITYNSIITNAKWVELAKEFDLCSEDDCLKNELFKSSNKDGYDARLIRSGSMITYTFWNKSSEGKKYSKYDQKQFVKNNMKDYDCK